MATLDDFSDEQETTLSLEQLSEADVQTRGITRVPHYSSNMDRAARSSLFSEDPATTVDTYRNILSELNEAGTSPTEDMVLKGRKDRYSQSKNASMFEVLSDPALSDQDKKKLIEDFAQSSYFSSYDAVLEDSVIAQSNEKTEEAQMTRVGFADMLYEANAANRRIQKMTNAVASSFSDKTSSAFTGLLEIVLPLTEWNQIRRIHKEFFGEGRDTSILETFMIGDLKVDVRDYLAQLPTEKRVEATQKLIEIIQENNQVLLKDDNDFATFLALQDFIEGDYGTSDKWIDNVTGMLDLIGIGAAARRPIELAVELTKAEKAARAGRGAGKAAGFDERADEAFRNAKKRGVASGTQATSSAKAFQDTNRQKAIATHKAVQEDETGELAEALYGTTREDAIASDYAPSVRNTANDSIDARQHNIGVDHDIKTTPNAETMDFTKRGGDIYFYKQEKEAMRSAVVANVADALGIRNRSEMMTTEHTAKGVRLSATYGPKESGFTNAADAIEHAKYSLRQYGLVDENFSLMKREGNTYRTLTPEEKASALTAKAEGDFLVRVDYDYKFNPLDVAEWMATDTLYNIFDRVGILNKASVQRSFLDPASFLDPVVVRAASVSVEKTAGIEAKLLTLGKTFTDEFVKFPKERQSFIYDYLKANNANGTAPSYTKMSADGFSQAEIDSVYKWKEYWDTHYHLENDDLRSSLRNQGYQVLEDIKTNTRLIAKPVARQQAGGFAKAYNPTTGQIESLSHDELSQLYKDGGSLNKLKRPSTFGGDEAIEYVRTENVPGGTYFRSFNDSDTVLNYREGYFHVSYDAPWFIEEIVRDKTGKELYRKSVAVAGSIKDAEHLVKRKTAVEGKEYVFRENRKGLIDVESDEYWDLMASGGRSPQMARGKRLEGADSPLSIEGGNDFILSPVDAMIETARSISRRVGMRGYLDTTKQRFIEQFGDFIIREAKDVPFGKPKFPSSADQLVKRAGTQSDKDLADARSMFEYINSLEHGYRNSIDDGTKAVLKVISETLGRAGMPRGEAAARTLAEAKGVSKQMKGLAFEVYLATNPLRQALVQSHQATLLAANFGKYGSGDLKLFPRNMAQLAQDTTALVIMQLNPNKIKEAAIISGRSVEEMRKLWKDYEYSGLTAGVSKNSLINDSLADLADQAAYNKNKTILAHMRLLSQKVGFEAGERFNISSAWLAHRDRALREGKELTDDVLDEVTASARNYTYNMNAAGEMPYNQNSLAVMFQFVQVFHKAMLQMTNRQLTRGEKLRLLAFQGVMFGLPAKFVYDTFSEIMPDDPQLQDALIAGLEGITLNTMLSVIAGDEVKLDYKSLAPLDMLGTYAFVEGLMEMDVSKIIAESPSGQMLFGSNPRLVNLAKTVAKYTNLVDDHEDPTTFNMVANEFFSTFSSGYSNAYKARYAYAYERKVSSIGNVSDRSINSIEAIAAAFGFRTLDEMKKAYISDTQYKKTEEWKTDLKQAYKDIRRHLSKKGVAPEDFDYEQRVINEIWRGFPENNTEERQFLVNMMRADAKRDADGSMIRDILRIANMDKGVDDARAMVRALPDEYAHQRTTLNDAIDLIERQATEMEKQ